MSEDRTSPLGRSRGRPSRRPEKHIAFFRLLEACDEEECPVCFLARRRVEQYFDGLLYEKVNDRELRRRFRSAGGFCNMHSFQFMGYHDGLAGSILYRDLLATWLERPSAFPVQASSGALPGCPACREKADTESTYLTLAAGHLEDEQLRQALCTSDGLCLPHFQALTGRLNKDRRAVPKWLMEFQREVAQRLVADLGTYLDACNYSLGSARPSLSREQELAWKRAVRKAAGFPAIPEKT
ncbi:MAG: hypothetical protein JXB06_10440 [Spirochaetales bacterium]|nr:hypothetical protein [Spirochaetales bacterium]